MPGVKRHPADKKLLASGQNFTFAQSPQLETIGPVKLF
jgi:hypothetical protein